jgi:hypothetical protein
MLTCEFCDCKFVNKDNLIYHQKNTVRCLKKRGKNTKIFKCDTCLKEYSANSSLQRHIKICKININNITNNVINNTINNIDNIKIGNVNIDTSNINPVSIFNYDDIFNKLLPIITKNIIEQGLDIVNEIMFKAIFKIDNYHYIYRISTDGNEQLCKLKLKSNGELYTLDSISFIEIDDYDNKYLKKLTTEPLQDIFINIYEKDKTNEKILQTMSEFNKCIENPKLYFDKIKIHIPNKFIDINQKFKSIVALYDNEQKLLLQRNNK